MKSMEADYSASETLHSKKQIKAGVVAGNFGRIFKAERKADGLPVVPHFVRIAVELQLD